MPDIVVDYTLTNLDGNGANLDYAEGRPLVRLFALTKTLAIFV